MKFWCDGGINIAVGINCLLYSYTGFTFTGGVGLLCVDGLDIVDGVADGLR